MRSVRPSDRTVWSMLLGAAILSAFDLMTVLYILAGAAVLTVVVLIGLSFLVTPKAFEPKGKTIVISGGSSGIGKAMAEVWVAFWK